MRYGHTAEQALDHVMRRERRGLLPSVDAPELRLPDGLRENAAIVARAFAEHMERKAMITGEWQPSTFSYRYCAKLCGLPPTTVERAWRLLQRLEAVEHAGHEARNGWKTWSFVPGVVVARADGVEEDPSGALEELERGTPETATEHGGSSLSDEGSRMLSDEGGSRTQEQGGSRTNRQQLFGRPYEGSETIAAEASEVTVNTSREGVPEGAVNTSRRCLYCGESIEHLAKQARHCKPSHRVMASRARKREREAEPFDPMLLERFSGIPKRRELSEHSLEWLRRYDHAKRAEPREAVSAVDEEAWARFREDFASRAA
jgi:hypothetical protein